MKTIVELPDDQLKALGDICSQEKVSVRKSSGAPPDEFLTGALAGREVVFLPRHGRGHRVLPSELNHRANIWAMKKTRRGFRASAPSARCKKNTARVTSCCPTSFSTAPSATLNILFRARHRRAHRVCRSGLRGVAENYFAGREKFESTAKAIVAAAIPQIPTEPNWPCHSALKNAIMTDRKAWPKKPSRN
jgi:hypothetical protein